MPKIDTAAAEKQYSIQEAGRLLHAANQVLSHDTKTTVIHHAEEVLAKVIQPVIEQYQDGLICASELMLSLAEVHHRVTCYTEQAAREDQICRDYDSFCERDAE